MQQVLDRDAFGLAFPSSRVATRSEVGTDVVRSPIDEKIVNEIELIQAHPDVMVNADGSAYMPYAIDMDFTMAYGLNPEKPLEDYTQDGNLVLTYGGKSITLQKIYQRSITEPLNIDTSSSLRDAAAVCTAYAYYNYVNGDTSIQQFKYGPITFSYDLNNLGDMISLSVEESDAQIRASKVLAYFIDVVTSQGDIASKQEITQIEQAIRLDQAIYNKQTQLNRLREALRAVQAALNMSNVSDVTKMREPLKTGNREP